MSRKIPWALTYRITDRVTHRKRRARWLVQTRERAEEVAKLMTRWPEFTDVRIVHRETSE